MDYFYLNAIVDFGVEKLMQHHEFYNDEVGWYHIF
jgi:hypothetical protein